MKNKILLISLVVVLALSVSLIGCGTTTTGPQPNDKIVIGMSRSMNGGLAIVHLSAFFPIYTAYVAYINGPPTNGITVGGQKFLVDVIAYDDNSNAPTLTANTATLISNVDKGDVHTIFGPTCTYFIDVMAPLTNTAKKVLMTAEGGGTFLIEDPGPPPLPGPITTYSYVFVTLSFSDWYQLPVLACALDEAHFVAEGAHNATAWIVYQDDAHGKEYVYAAQKYFTAAGITIKGITPVLHSLSYPYATTLLNTIAPANPDILCLFCYPNEIYSFVGLSWGTQTNFKAVVGGPGACFGVFYDNLGAVTEEIVTFAVGNNKTSNAGNPIPNATITMETLFNSIIGSPAGDWSDQDAWGHPLYWAALEIWQHAVEQVGYVQDGGFMIDQDALKTELHKYKDATGGVNTVLGKTWYHFFGTGGAGGGILDYVCHTGEIGQWQNGYIEVVAPTQVLATNLTKVNLLDLLPRYRATLGGGIEYPKDNWPPPP